MRREVLLASLLGIIIGIWGCKSEPIGPFPSEPILKVLDIGPDTLREYQDSLYVLLGYEDANGDLGTLDPDEKSLWMKDSRLPEADLYHVRPLAPLDAAVHISGTLRMDTKPLFLLGNGDWEAVIFKLKILDRAGNWSEIVSTDTVIVKR